MKKVVLKVDVNEDKIKQKAMEAVSGISGVESVFVDVKNQTLTLLGDIDPAIVDGKLREVCDTDILSVEAAKEEKKKKKKDKNQNVADIVKDCEVYNNPMGQPHYYYYRSVELNLIAHDCWCCCHCGVVQYQLFFLPLILFLIYIYKKYIKQDS